MLKPYDAHSYSELLDVLTDDRTSYHDRIRVWTALAVNYRVLVDFGSQFDRPEW